MNTRNALIAAAIILAILYFAIQDRIHRPIPPQRGIDISIEGKPVPTHTALR